MMNRTTFAVLIFLFLAACSQNKNCGSEVKILSRVSLYSDSGIVAATYFSADTNIALLAKELWKEKEILLQGKSDTTIFYLFVFNRCRFIPDISADYKKAWEQMYYTSRFCVLDNGFGFARFCYGIRFDEGRIGDWRHIRFVNEDGSFAETKFHFQ